MTSILDKIKAVHPEQSFFSLEFFPPKTAAGFQNLLPRLQRLRSLHPLFVTVTFNAGGTTAQKSLELADICQNQLGLTTCLHLTCTNLRHETIDWVLRSAKEIGIRNILALRGDEPRKEGDFLEWANGVSNGSQNPVANGHSAPNGAKGGVDSDGDVTFAHATDLIRYIRKGYGSFFTIGCAAYPEGHPTPSPNYPGGFSQSPLHDLPFLIEKVRAGADFILSQLFFNAEQYIAFENLCRNESSGILSKIPIIPGLMPVQGWNSFIRTVKLASVHVPEVTRKRLEAFKDNDEEVKTVGVDILTEVIQKIKTGRREHDVPMPVAQGYHFYTLNLEKAVAQILERCDLVPQTANERAVESTSASPEPRPAKSKRRRSSAAHNRVIVSRPSMSAKQVDFEALADEAGQPRATATKEDSLAIAEGEGSLGREATWDDFPNGRWGDARSPAFGMANNYAMHPQLAPFTALPLWGNPASREDITSIFRRYLSGEVSMNPWSEDELSAETSLIRNQLLKLCERCWWTVASQPAVNAARSDHEIFGWGPKQSGFVWQKPFVEFFCSPKDWEAMRHKLSALNEEVTYFAGNVRGDFSSNDGSSVNAVTWGAFKGKEIITPTIIEAVSFRSWLEEAFGIWREWRQVFPPASPSAKLLEELRNEFWLVNVVGHDYSDSGRLWQILLDS